MSVTVELDQSADSTIAEDEQNATPKQPEPKYVLVTRAGNVPRPRKLRYEDVDLIELEYDDGSHPRFRVYELTVADWDAHIESGRVYDDNGNLTKIKRGGEAARLLSWTVRDTHGNRLWEDPEDAEKFFGEYAKGDIDPLVTASYRVNGPRSADAEKNSGKTQSSDSSSD